MTRIYGYSDDNVVIEETGVCKDEIGCYDSVVDINFDDGTKIGVTYPKENMAVWNIRILKAGTANSKLTVCTDENAEIYSDIFEIDAKITDIRIHR